MKLIAIAFDGIGNKDQDIFVALAIYLDLVLGLAKVSIEGIHHPVGPDKVVKRRPEWNITSAFVRVTGRVPPTGISSRIGIDGSPGCNQKAFARIRKGKDDLDTSGLAGSSVARWAGSTIITSRSINARREWITSTIIAAATFVDVGTGITIAREASVTGTSEATQRVLTRRISITRMSAVRTFVVISTGNTIAAVASVTNASVTARNIFA